MTLRLLVDVEALVIDFLIDQADVKALVAGAVSQDAGKKHPHVRVSRIPGPGVANPAWLDSARLQIEARAAGRDAAIDVARTVQAALLQELPGQHETGVVTDVVEVMAPAWLPDPTNTPATPRYVSVIAVFAHPLP